MLNNFVNFEKKITKLSGIAPWEKCINRLGGDTWRNFLMGCSKHEVMAIYVVKQACGNDIMACVYEWELKKLINSLLTSSIFIM